MSKFTKWYGPKAKAAGYRPQAWTAAGLVRALGAEFTVFTSFGHVNGMEGFAREHCRVDGDMLAVICDGRVIQRHPMSRSLRILVK